jgi:hypothetical protein
MGTAWLAKDSKISVTKNLGIFSVKPQSFSPLSDESGEKRFTHAIHSDSQVVIEEEVMIELEKTASLNSTHISFTVFGKPMALARHRSTKTGIFYNPAKKVQIEFLSACSTFLPSKPLEGPLHATITFYFKRPKSHYSTRKSIVTLKPGMSGNFYANKPGKFYC